MKINIIIASIFILSSFSFSNKKKYEDVTKEIMNIDQENFYTNNEKTIQEKKMKIAESLSANLFDKYSEYFSPADYAEFKSNANGDLTAIGVELIKHADGVEIVSVTDKSSAANAQLKHKDIIFKINDIEIQDLSLFQIGKLIHGKTGEFIVIDFIDSATKTKKTISIKRQSIDVKNVEIITKDKVSEIKIRYFDYQTPDKFASALEEISPYNPVGLILDLRNNPGGLLDGAIETLSYLTSESLLTQIKNKKGETFFYTSINSLPFLDSKFERFKKIPIAILVNGGSASASEIFASAIKDLDRGKIIGEKTFGKGVVQDFFELKSIPGSALKITIAEYVSPKGSKIDNIGVIPDFECDFNICNYSNLSKKIISSYY